MTGASVTTDEAVRKARFEKLWEAVDVAATTLATAIDALPISVQDRALRRAVGDICSETDADDPFTTLDNQPDLDAILRDIRHDLKRGDVEHAFLVIHYELGDY